MLNDGRVDAQNNGLTHDPKSVNPDKHYGQSLHNFNNSYDHATSERYADISPFMALDLVGGDVVPFRSLHNVRTYTMGSPIEDPIYKTKFYTLVPFRAILPECWKYFYAHPTHGDDVPDDVYCNAKILDNWKTLFSRRQPWTLEQKLRFIVSTELLFSKGSLPTKFKCNLWPLFDHGSDGNLDDLLDVFYNTISEMINLEVEVRPDEFITLTTDPDNSFFTYVNVHDFVDILRTGNYTVLPYSVEVTDIEAVLDNFLTSLVPFTDFGTASDIKLDLSKFIAYQISCMSQVSDSSIDYVFNAQLYRGYLFPSQGLTYEYNGRHLVYDVFSYHYFHNYWFADIDRFNDSICYLFNFNKSLKFGDYFTTSRPRALAVGDINVSPNDDGSINSLEQSRSIVYTRFLNWSNRVGPKYDDYIKELTGKSALADPTEPSFVAISRSLVKGYEVENTGSDQRQGNSVTTIVNSNQSNEEFDIVVNEDSILLGLTCYDVPRLYTRGIDRSFFKEDRFDFFNHMLQYTGDQEINGRELDVRFGDRPIAYTTKDQHYKMQVSHASGAFLGPLKVFAYSTEVDTLNLMSLGINPLFIRNFNGTFDRFYTSVTGVSLGNYFHFYCRYKNDFSEMKRPMDVAPDIL